MTGETSITKKCEICGEIKYIEKQLALETIGASEIILATYLFNMFKEFPKKEKIVDGIIKNYKKEITEWLNDKTKVL